MNPWALIWANDRYYLYGYDVKEKDGVLSERNYRVDKLDNIKLSDIPRAGKSQFRIFNANTYVSTQTSLWLLISCMIGNSKIIYNFIIERKKNCRIFASILFRIYFHILFYQISHSIPNTLWF